MAIRRRRQADDLLEFTVEIGHIVKTAVQGHGQHFFIAAAQSDHGRLDAPFNQVIKQALSGVGFKSTAQIRAA